MPLIIIVYQSWIIPDRQLKYTLFFAAGITRIIDQKCRMNPFSGLTGITSNDTNKSTGSAAGYLKRKTITDS